ncbi:ATP dependent DNA ligase domain-containing protein [Bradyrhizobium brasilense]|uniref:ATP dependent DNA ligase domain-containing protein n=1 Tax=Bradyrhizobium brasilense TaxID=1419277 RepID=A0A1G7K2E0_9BRAD|nr:DNA ligase [Bradyrhizobium brasilense]SDF31423.1 ATP dependent DNA ligase domain-containing protein [Bradyrhizobium brasilense]
MPKFEFCLPTVGKVVPAGLEWLHEIKYDGYRLRLERDGDRVRLITKGGHDWTKRFPWVVEAALNNRQKQFVIDGEAIVRGVDGYSDFNALHSGKHNAEVEMLAFDILAMDGDDLRDLSLNAQNKPAAVASPPSGGHLRVGLRARRDRAGPVPEGLRVRLRGPRVEALRPSLPWRALPALDQGQEPDASGNVAGVLSDQRRI